MRVSLAAELLSHTTAVNLRRNYPDEYGAHLLANMIETVNNYFDVFNSRCIQESIPTKKPYGLNLPDQEKWLDNMFDLVQNMRTLKPDGAPEKKLQIFQKGILFSIISFKKLFVQMQEEFGVKFILGHKVNQDPVENLFAQVRVCGAITHPTPLQATHKLRLITLGRNLQGHLKTGQNTIEFEDEDQFLITKIFKSCFKSNNSDNIDISLSSISTISSVSSTMTNMTLTEDDAFRYVMGYLAKKFRGKYPELGSFTYKQAENENPDFVQMISYGGLTNPSEDFMSTAKKMEKMFRKIHLVNKDSDLKDKKVQKSAQNLRKIEFRHRNNVVKSTIQQMKPHFPDVEQDLLEAFVIQRVNIRTAHMNKQLQEDKYIKFQERKRRSNEKAMKESDKKKIKQFTS